MQNPSSQVNSVSLQGEQLACLFTGKREFKERLQIYQRTEARERILVDSRQTQAR